MFYSSGERFLIEMEGVQDIPSDLAPLNTHTPTTKAKRIRKKRQPKARRNMMGYGRKKPRSIRVTVGQRRQTKRRSPKKKLQVGRGQKSRKTRRVKRKQR